MPTSLRGKLLVLLLIPLAVGWAINTAVTWRTAVDSANQAYDRSLRGAALSISERVLVDEGHVIIDLPFSVFETLETSVHDRIYYKVSSSEQGLITGYEDLPAPPEGMLAPGKPHFYNTTYKNEGVRIAAVLRPMYDPTVKSPLLIQVGETLDSRRQLSTRLLAETAFKELLLIFGAAALIWFGVAYALRPLERIHDEVARRSETDLTALDAGSAPKEVAPLIEAINAHTQRLTRLNEAQRQFIADASHQLKTPLAVIKTQSELALRQSDIEAMRGLVREIHDSTDNTTRLAHQLLALARSEQQQPADIAVRDLTELARTTTFAWIPRALNKSIDLGFEGEQSCPVLGSPSLLHELLSNLIDNAIRYTPAHGHVTVRVKESQAGLLLEVEDNGPGIAPELRKKVFDRFYRVPGNASEGCGLGLAIVRGICTAHGARIALRDRESRQGLIVEVAFPVQHGVTQDEILSRF